MPLASVTAALAQFNANPPSTWASGGAAACLDAVYYLLANRGQKLEDVGTSIDYASLESVKRTLETRLGTSAPRAMGRKRRNIASFGGDGIQ